MAKGQECDFVALVSCLAAKSQGLGKGGVPALLPYAGYLPAGSAEGHRVASLYMSEQRLWTEI